MKVHVHVHECVYKCAYVCVYVLMCVYACVRTFECVYIPVHVCANVHVLCIVSMVAVSSGMGVGVYIYPLEMVTQVRNASDRHQLPQLQTVMSKFLIYNHHIFNLSLYNTKYMFMYHFSTGYYIY